MERTMSATGLDESAFRRVALIAGATSAVMIALLCVKPIYSMATQEAATGSAVVSQRAAQEPKIETISFVPSATTDTSPQFFFGSGDGSNGYYDERPTPTR
jgi:hypothetical protein